MDVNFRSLMDQERKPDVWVIADDLYDLRAETVREMTDGCGFEVRHFKPREKPEGYFSDLSEIYNEMLAAASVDCDIAVSVQDYHWVNPLGLMRFEMDYVALGDDALVTGICSQSLDPGPDKVVEPEGLWTVYAEPYDGHEPTEMFWEDVRIYQVGNGDKVIPWNPIGWELNYAMIPTEMYRRGARFPEHYGRGIGHENIAFAMECMLNQDVQVWMDPPNRAWGLPHKAYWPQQEATGGPKSVENMEMFWSEYGAAANVLGV